MTINSNNKNESLLSDRFGYLSFLGSVIVLTFCFGVFVGRSRVFPYPVFSLAMEGLREIRSRVQNELPWFYFPREGNQETPIVRNTDRAYMGLNVVTSLTSDRIWVAEIMDMDGQVLHEWKIDWFELWPDAEHLPENRVPRDRPGTNIHGLLVMDNGDLVFNFEERGLVRLSKNGEVLWRLPYLTHHSLERDDSGNLWVGGMVHRTETDPRFPNRIPPFFEFTLLELTPDGEIIEEWSVSEILAENGMHGLLHMGTLNNRTTQVGPYSDLLHVNDVEPFPSSFEEDFFEQGDIMVSLRNINTVFVFNRYSRNIKFITTGLFVRQHDPDFIDGNRFSVFDNNNIGLLGDKGYQSRIMIISARDNSAEIYFEGDSQVPFYTDIMGEHEWLPNGNLLITEASEGRVFEIDRQGEVVWEYVNYTERGIGSIVPQLHRLPLGYSRAFDSIAPLESQ